MRFDRILIVDWSAAAVPRRGVDSIWIGEARRPRAAGGPVIEGAVAEGAAAGGAVAPVNPPTRAAAMAVLRGRLDACAAAGERVLVGVDFPLGYPAGFARAVSGRDGAFAVWERLAAMVEDGPDNANNRFAVASRLNALLPGVGPFWGCPPGRGTADLPQRGTDRAGHGMPRLRRCEAGVPGVQSCWKLFTRGSVGSQAILGIARMAGLRAAMDGRLAVWPLEPVETADVVLAEVFPSLIAPAVAAALAAGRYGCKDAAQVDLLARALAAVDLGPLLAPDAPAEVLGEEGWILGAGKEAVLLAALAGDGAADLAGARRVDADRAPLVPPRLRNDCFAMPQGIDWVPVDVALARLRDSLVPVTGTEAVPLAEAGGRILAQAAVARRSNPPAANAAVDGYGFAHAALQGAGPHEMPLVDGRAAAGQPFAGSVPAGAAIRILTGAILPTGVDTVVLEEDCALGGGRVAFDGPVKPRANTRRAGEDVEAGATALPAGQRLRAPDVALLAALGVARVTVWRRLRVAVLSTGDEICDDPGADAALHQIHDANRPLLLETMRRWGYAAVDLGHVGDDPEAIAARLDAGAAAADVILTSGGASAGDEDHVSALLRQRGVLSSWRIAMKPGRPLALALWQAGTQAGAQAGQDAGPVGVPDGAPDWVPVGARSSVPVFGLPGNPVAAFVCALVFARPALSLLAGAGWAEPQGFAVPAGFSKRKKAGRREYLRARLDDGGRAEVFGSEGSGRISGLAWASGLVELPDGAVEIAPGDPVRFLPYAGFGL